MGDWQRDLAEAFERRFFVTAKQEILEEALAIVTGPRQELYGRPSGNFEDTAALLNSIFANKFAHNAEGELESIWPHEVAIIMICLKLARLISSPEHKDNWTDIIGYAACGWECVTQRPPGSPAVG